jgi:hypothetical protein
MLNVYQHEQWHDFFVMVGGAAAALAGLVFVAMSLNLATIFQDPTHRFRAIGTLAGFTSVFAICALVLMGGQNHVAIGLEWFAVSTVATFIYVKGYVQAIKQGGSAVGLRMPRLIGGTGCHVAEMIGALMLALGHPGGLYVAAVAMVIYVAYMVSGAWLLLVGVHQGERQHVNPAPSVNEPS